MTQENRKKYDHFVTAPPRRVGGLGIVRNSAGNVLMVRKSETSSKPLPWYHPGGCVEGNEVPTDALVRIAYAKLGITLKPGRLLVVHHMPEQDHGDHVSVEGYNFLYDCGVLDDDTEFTLGAGALGVHWMTPDDLTEMCAPFTAQRTFSALKALEGDVVEFLFGHPPVE